MKTLCFFLIGLGFLFSHAAFADLRIDTTSIAKEKSAVERFLSSQRNEFEGAESTGDLIVDIDADGNQEVIFVWTTLGPTYWKNTLTVLSQNNNEYVVSASLPLIGEAKLSTVKDKIIYVNQVIYAEGDPICCPTVKTQKKYRWIENQLSEIE